MRADGDPKEADPMLPVTDLAAYLAGEWLVERALHERSTGERGTFRGRVAFRPGEDGALLQHEHGELVWGDHRGPAYRMLRMEATEDPGVLDVRFDDGRYFHRLDLRSGRATAEHPCGPDTYAGEFEVDSDRLWSYRWTVTGPAKSLLLSSTLTRSAG